MGVETDVHRALEHVRRERERTAEKRAQFERFESAVEDLETGRPAVGRGGNGPGGGPGGGTGGSGSGGRGTATGTRAGTDTWTATASTGATAAAASAQAGPSVGAVLEAFEEHLAAYSGDALTEPDTVHEAVAEEFSTDLATALCGGASAGALTPTLKAAVLEETRSRDGELAVTTAALERECESLATALEAIEPVLEWFVENNPTPLSELGFDQLRAWHERVDEHRATLERTARDRQSHLRTGTTRSGAVGIEHDVLREYCYAEFADSHPVLATVARLEEACQSAQRGLREHLSRRV